MKSRLLSIEFDVLYYLSSSIFFNRTSHNSKKRTFDSSQVVLCVFMLGVFFFSSFNPHNNLLRLVLLLPSFYRCRVWNQLIKWRGCDWNPGSLTPEQSILVPLLVLIYSLFSAYFWHVFQPPFLLFMPSQISFRSAQMPPLLWSLP